MENEYGEIIAYERSMSNVSVQKLCDGLCSVAHLQRIEKGERFCEKILADALLQRIGVSSDKFAYILNGQEQSSIVLKEKIVALVDDNQREDACLCIEEYKKLIQDKSVIHKQFCLLAKAILEWKNGKDSQPVLNMILEAWNLTKNGKSISKLKGQYLSFFEIALAMLYMRLMEGSKEEESVGEGYEEILFYLEQRVDVQDRVKWFPQAAYRLILLKKNGDRKRAIQICETTLKLLQKQASLNYLAEILGEYSELLKKEYTLQSEKIPPDIKKRLFEIDLIRESLDWLYKEYEIRQVEWIWNISFGMSEVYLYQDIIRGRRIGMGMSQEQLAEGICNAVTISRIECGKGFPKRKVLAQLLQKIKWAGENCTLTVQIGRPEYHRITSQISLLTHTEKFEEAEELLEELERKIHQKTIYAEQYFLNHSVVKYRLGKMDSKTCFMLQKQAFSLTVPNDISYEKLKQWHFSRMEIMCINGMSYFCEEMGKEQEVLKLLLLVQKFYERQLFQLRYYRAGYELTMRNIGNLLGNMGEYEEAIKAADICIALALSLQKGGNVARALYDKGWDMEGLWEKQLYTKERSLAYIKTSYALHLFLGEDIQCRFIINHMKELYNENIYGSSGEFGKSE